MGSVDTANEGAMTDDSASPATDDDGTDTAVADPADSAGGDVPQDNSGEVDAPGVVDCSAIGDNPNWDLCESGDGYCTAVFNDGAGCDSVCAAAGLSCVESWENAEGSCAPDMTLAQLSCGQADHQSDFCRCAGEGSPTGTGMGQDEPTTDDPAMDDQSAADDQTATDDATMDEPAGDSPAPGQISINDPTPGFASVSGGTTGGGTDLSSAITVSSMGELQNAAGGSQPAIILVQPGDYQGTFRPGSNKTIIGVAPGVKISGNMDISGGSTSNVIVRNIAIQGPRCSSYDQCKAGSDAVYVGSGAQHVWLDHLDVSDGQDGNLDITQAADFVTVSWTNFYYTYDKEHRYSNLIAGGDDEVQSAGKLKITYMACHWGERVDQRQPRGRFGDIHMLNNYHNTGGSAIHGVGRDMAMIAENSVYDENRSIWKDMGSPRGWKGIGNIGSASGLTESRGSVFDIPYEYTAMPADQVKEAVTSPDCGAGNTCTLQQ
jgi:pectate lyase